MKTRNSSLKSFDHMKLTTSPDKYFSFFKRINVALWRSNDFFAIDCMRLLKHAEVAATCH